MADRVIRFRSGKVTEITKKMTTPIPVEKIEW